MTEAEINALPEEKKDLLFIINTLTWLNKTVKAEPNRIFTAAEEARVGLAMLKAMEFSPFYIVELLKGVGE